MKFLALVSGGKDSIYSLSKLIDEGNTLVGILNMKSNKKYSDSYMFQTVGSEAIKLIGECLECPTFIEETSCNSKNIDLEYCYTENDEVEELFNSIEKISKIVEFEGISSGAILSNYQARRVENICNRLNKKALCPLWNRNQLELLEEMIEYGIDGIIVKIASSLFNKNCLKMNLTEIRNYMAKINSKYDINYCGEGGEYETIVLDCKYFKKKIKYKKAEILCHPEDENKQNGVYYLELKDLYLETKSI